jgi:hypothetical protein
MRLFRSARWLLLALLLPLIPATQAHAGVFISVNFGPPVLPVYVQPICPQPGLMWTPGYWAYGPDGYYWVPGAWVPSPYVGGLWTPPYWGWGNGLYIFHPGYWGPHVGYYGGINYGFGYGGIGFAGGMWRGGVFAYNTAIMRVGSGGAWGNRVYADRGAVDRGYGPGGRDSRVAFNGGQGGIRYQPSAQERSYMNERHVAPTSFQSQHEVAARNDRTSYAKANGGRPQNLVSQRPLQGENRPAPGARPGNDSRPSGPANTGNRPAVRPSEPSRPAYNQPQTRPTQESRPAQPQQRPATRPTPQPRSTESRPAAPARQESRPAPKEEHPRGR